MFRPMINALANMASSLRYPYDKRPAAPKARRLYALNSPALIALRAKQTRRNHLRAELRFNADYYNPCVNGVQLVERHSAFRPTL